MPDIYSDEQREAERLLFQAIGLVEEERLAEAHRLLEKACALDPQNPKALSYFGLTNALGHDFVQKGLELCRKAAEKGLPDPSIYLNLAKVCFKSGNRRSTVAALQYGLKIDRGNKAILDFWYRIGFRRKPPIPFLDRDNIFNKMIGKMTWKGKAAAKGKGKNGRKK
jgi:tetratricopeptide (TPR) repeat protein